MRFMLIKDNINMMLISIASKLNLLFNNLLLIISWELLIVIADYKNIVLYY